LTIYILTLGFQQSFTDRTNRFRLLLSGINNLFIGLDQGLHLEKKYHFCYLELKRYTLLSLSLFRIETLFNFCVNHYLK